MVSIGYEEMMAVSPDYVRLIDETKRTLLEYAVQDWPVVKSTVRNCICIIDHKNDIKTDWFVYDLHEIHWQIVTEFHAQ